MQNIDIDALYGFLDSFPTTEDGRGVASGQAITYMRVDGKMFTEWN